MVSMKNEEDAGKELMKMKVESKEHNVSKERGKKRKKENYLERRPMRVPDIVWSLEAGEGGAVILHIINRGFFHRAAQLLFRRPRISHVKLDALGSLVWTLADGRQSLLQLGEAVRERFGAQAEPLYERLVVFVHTLEDCRLICWKLEDERMIRGEHPGDCKSGMFLI